MEQDQDCVIVPVSVASLSDALLSLQPQHGSDELLRLCIRSCIDYINLTIPGWWFPPSYAMLMLYIWCMHLVPLRPLGWESVSNLFLTIFAWFLTYGSLYNYFCSSFVSPLYVKCTKGLSQTTDQPMCLKCMHTLSLNFPVNTTPLAFIISCPAHLAIQAMLPSHGTLTIADTATDALFVLVC
jgi:hypothetical protein